MALKKKSKLAIIVLALVVLGGIIGYKITYKAHETIQDMKVEYKGQAQDIVSVLSDAPEKWQNKIVELTGTISQIDQNGFMLNESIYCVKDKTSKSSLIENNSYTIKGRIIGYDDLMEELKLDKVIILK
ncbi:MAG: hypothetical protein ACPG6V_13265 [Flavobacteriales bacterium]